MDSGFNKIEKVFIVLFLEAQSWYKPLYRIAI